MCIRPIHFQPSALVFAQQVMAFGRMRLLLGTSQSLLVLRLRFRNSHLALMPYAAARPRAIVGPPVLRVGRIDEPAAALEVEPTVTLAQSTPPTSPHALDLLA